MAGGESFRLGSETGRDETPEAALVGLPVTRLKPKLRRPPRAPGEVLPESGQGLDQVAHDVGERDQAQHGRGAGSAGTPSTAQ
jgi:hypothetical protein